MHKNTLLCITPFKLIVIYYFSNHDQFLNCPVQGAVMGGGGGEARNIITVTHFSHQFPDNWQNTTSYGL